MSIEPTSNPSALAAAGEGRAALLVTGGGCSCAWYRRPSGSGSDERLAHARAKYERLGWSQSKIERALGSMVSRPRADDGLHPTIVELLRDLALAHGSVAVWVHDFSGQAEAEAYTIAKREIWTVADLGQRAMTLDLDVVGEIVRSGA